jgi:hypothetical protein
MARHYTSQDVDTVLAQFEVLAAAKRAALAGPRFTPPLHYGPQQEKNQLLRELAEIEHGIDPSAGTTTRGLGDLVYHPTVRRFCLARPGIASLTRLRDHLRVEEQMADAPWPRRCRYTGLDGDFRMGATRLTTGDVVELTKNQWHTWRSVFCLVGEDVAVATTADVKTAPGDATAQG